MTWLGVKDEITPMFWIVDDYFNKKFLAKSLGFSFDGSQLSDFEVEAYAVIANEAAKMEEAEARFKNQG
jgi:hypothetical protein